MNFKSVYKYQVNQFKKPIMYFYLAIAGILILIETIPALIYYDGHNTLTIITFEFGSAFFLFAGGLNSYRDSFRGSLQNGVSRKTIWIGTVLSFLTISGVMAVIDTLIRLDFEILAGCLDRVKIKGPYEILYIGRSMENHIFQNTVEELFLNFCLYTAALAFGYFIIVGIYRMNTIARIIVPTGLIGLFFFVLPRGCLQNIRIAK